MSVFTFPPKGKDLESERRIPKIVVCDIATKLLGMVPVRTKLNSINGRTKISCVWKWLDT